MCDERVESIAIQQEGAGEDGAGVEAAADDGGQFCVYDWVVYCWVDC